MHTRFFVKKFGCLDEHLLWEWGWISWRGWEGKRLGVLWLTQLIINIIIFLYSQLSKTLWAHCQCRPTKIIWVILSWSGWLNCIANFPPSANVIFKFSWLGVYLMHTEGSEVDLSDATIEILSSSTCFLYPTCQL